jgi:hypothetical protein
LFADRYAIQRSVATDIGQRYHYHMGQKIVTNVFFVLFCLFLFVVLNRFAKHGLVVHVTGGHADFEDDYLFFRYDVTPRVYYVVKKVIDLPAMLLL